MVRWLALAVLVVAISAAAAWVSLSVPAGGTSGRVAFPAGSSKDVMAGPPPSLVLDEDTTFDFGIMDQNETDRRDFVIGNEGPGDLILTGTSPSCSCTVANLNPGEQAVVKPGEQFRVTIEWETLQNRGRYEKQAEIDTNDPNRPRLVFTVQGEVQPAVVTVPEDGSLDLRHVSNDRAHEFEAFVSAPGHPDMKIESLSTSRPELLALNHRPMDEEERARLDLKGGHRIGIEVQPVGELGPFLEEILVRTNHPKRPEVRLTVGGTIAGPISVVPPTVRISDVLSHKGGESSVVLWVRGQAETDFQVEDLPDALNVRITPVERKTEERADASGRAYRMTVTVKPGTPAGVINRRIVLKTDHPKAEEVIVPVEIRVLGEG